MATVLLDTSVASFFHPGREALAYRRLYEPDLVGNVLAVSFQTVAELLLWAEQNNWGVARRRALEHHLARLAVIPYDLELARTWARVMASSRAAGRRLESGDAWVAATAIHHRLVLVTHDRDLRDLVLPGLTVVCHA